MGDADKTFGGQGGMVVSFRSLQHKEIRETAFNANSFFSPKRQKAGQTSAVLVLGLLDGSVDV